MDFERGIDFFQMGINGIGFNAELMGDFGIRESTRGQPCHLLLARCEHFPFSAADNPRRLGRRRIEFSFAGLG